jgi:GNAT superfamily N-acetyltransferase
MSKSSHLISILNEIDLSNDKTPHIDSEENNENLKTFLGVPNSPEMEKWFGKEKIKKISDKVVRADGEYGSWRYLYIGEDGEYVGVIQGVSRDGKDIVSNAYVRLGYRRKGIGTKLMDIIKKQKKGLVINNGGFSISGAAFVGIE